MILRILKWLGVTALTPLLEKNVVKTLGHESPLVMSMSRIIAVAFAVVTLKQFWQSGINGWPDATLGIAVVLALPVMSNLERANPDEILAVTRMLLAKWGGTARAAEPSKFDDHRPDVTLGGAKGRV